MSKNDIKKIISNTFIEIAEAIESGGFGKKIKIGLTTLGSEYGIDNLIQGANLAKDKLNQYEIVLIGPKIESDLEIIEANDEITMHKKMEQLLDSGYIEACITMHYNFAIGVSTVGRVVTPGRGKEILIATTTGTSAINRIEAMVKNALYGIITAKSIGIKNPLIGILNVDGARQVEKALKELKENGYEINLVNSIRLDSGCIMRGNDLLVGVPDVMVTDTLNGNILMKIFSAFNTGGIYEAAGYGYGPGIGENYDRNIFIISRTSGSMVVANAIKFAFETIKGNIKKIASEEFYSAKNANLNKILKNANKEISKEEKEVKAPPKEVVTSFISGIDIMDLENAIKLLWKNNIYAESGMGCSGPIVFVNEIKLKEAMNILKKYGYHFYQGDIC